MTYIAGVDIGNSTTEVCIGGVEGTQVHFEQCFLQDDRDKRNGCQCVWNPHSFKRRYGKDRNGDGSAVFDPVERSGSGYWRYGNGDTYGDDHYQIRQ